MRDQQVYPPPIVPWPFVSCGVHGFLIKMVHRDQRLTLSTFIEQKRRRTLINSLRKKDLRLSSIFSFFVGWRVSVGRVFSRSSSIPRKCNSKIESHFPDSEFPDATNGFDLAEAK